MEWIILDDGTDKIGDLISEAKMQINTLKLKENVARC
jgi:hypothetical protein